MVWGTIKWALCLWHVIPPSLPPNLYIALPCAAVAVIFGQLQSPTICWQVRIYRSNRLKDFLEIETGPVPLVLLILTYLMVGVGFSQNLKEKKVHILFIMTLLC